MNISDDLSKRLLSKLSPRTQELLRKSQEMHNNFPNQMTTDRLEGIASIEASSAKRLASGQQAIDNHIDNIKKTFGL